MSPERILRGKVAGLYALLGALALFWTAAGVIGIATFKGKASKSSVAAIEKKVTATEAAGIKTACARVAATASAEGLIITSCKLHKGKGAWEAKGDTALVVVDAVSTQATFVVQVALNKGAWTAGEIRVITAKENPTPKGVPSSSGG